MTRDFARMMRAPLALGAAALALLATQGTALADPCTNQTHGSTTRGGPVLFDSQGYYYDTNGTSGTFSRDDTYATLYDSGSDGPTDTPPGPVSNSDAYDSWGALFVGGDADSNTYWDSNEQGCAHDIGGQEIVFAPVNMGGLLVQRRIFVSSSGLPGARLVEYVTNTSGAPVTTSVQVGDDQSSFDQGDLGSDTDTAVRFDSSGTDSLGAHDLWAVTSDHDGSNPPNDNSDNALAHVFDGGGGADRIDFAGFSGTDSDPMDNLLYRWDNVTIAPGQTAAFMSFEVQQTVASLDAAQSDAKARDAALAYEAAPFDQLYAGMSDAQIAAVRNWPKPRPTAKIAVSPGPLGQENVPLSFSAAGSTASSTAGICQARSYSWDLGDGTKSAAETFLHQFKAGQYDVTLTVANSCGETATATQHVVIAGRPAAPALVARAALANHTTLARLLKGKVKEKLASSETASVLIVGTIPSALAHHAGAARIGRRVMKLKARLSAGKAKKVTLKLTKKAAKRLKGYGRHHRHKSFTLVVKNTVKGGTGPAKVVTKRIKVRF